MNLRFQAIDILTSSLQQQKHLDKLIEMHRLHDGKGLSLVAEICYGVMRYLVSLEKIALRFAAKLKLTPFEKMALFVGLYQLLFLHVPDHAAIFETIEAIKTKVPKSKCSFIHAILQKAKNMDLTIDENENFPSLFLQKLKKRYPGQREKVLSALMQKPKWFGRKQGSLDYHNLPKEEIGEFIKKGGYIQNPMSIMLMRFLAISMKQPETMIDLCAGKGGKTLLAKELFPSAHMTAVEKNPAQIEQFKENQKAHPFDCDVFCMDVLDLNEDCKFDLVILDVPCSNSGVYAKHPEAKWRLDAKGLKELNQLQTQLLKKAFQLVKPGGEIWYLTCSILYEENQKITAQFRKKKEKQILPDLEGIHGGYGCSFKKAK